MLYVYNLWRALKVVSLFIIKSGLNWFFTPHRWFWNKSSIVLVTAQILKEKFTPNQAYYDRTQLFNSLLGPQSYQSNAVVHIGWSGFDQDSHHEQSNCFRDLSFYFLSVQVNLRSLKSRKFLNIKKSIILFCTEMPHGNRLTTSNLLLEIYRELTPKSPKSRRSLERAQQWEEGTW